MAVKKEKIAKIESPALLPEGWHMVKFGDVVRNVDVSERKPLEKGIERYVGLEHIDPESLHIKRWGLIEEGTSFTRKFVKGQVLFGKRRAYQRKAALADFDGICSGDILVFETKKDALIPELLPFIVQSDGFYNHALSTSAGSLSPRTKWKDLAAYNFALPPKDEQRRIADLFWAADESRECYLRSLKHLEEFESIVATKLISSSRDKVRLKELADVSYGLTVNTSRREMPINMPYLRVANVMRGGLNLSEVKTIGCTIEDIERFSLYDEDVLVVEGHASVDEIGRAALWKSQIERCLHQNHILRVRCGKNLVASYIVAYLNSPSGRAYFRRHAKSTSGLHTINSTILKEVEVPLLSIAEQELAVKTLKCIEQKRHTISLHLVMHTELKRDLLKNLLDFVLD